MIRLAAVVISAGILVTGCGSDEAETPAAPSWDPCTVSDQLITEAGFAAASKRKDVAADTGDAWTGCGWSSADAAVRIQFADDTELAQLREEPGIADVTDTTVANRPALRFHHYGDGQDTNCSLALGTAAGGVVRIRVDRSADPAGESSCTRVERITAVLAPGLPS
ncbi:DUF3558 family protein [Nocardia cyriacigeorgica]|uniref:DUF3558 family protein n=1 Tax=Nocardia cyriacigeorgica TaxID=135487 RepID=UPI001892F1B4|nr:DUF3558 family protein [Nocardia cyriacigeorgica]MBF6457175.1 DUF3558 domain-containing protein [Nocardia cyriacigeorgica]MBF6480824.1 DUF3558 domain-containing protein [Nocardia cyriacigeorgica]MBF6554164.1 DUF3558 domain-containing protein [Nocardia cyriacigeorgica]